LESIESKLRGQELTEVESRDWLLISGVMERDDVGKADVHVGSVTRVVAVSVSEREAAYDESVEEMREDSKKADAERCCSRTWSDSVRWAISTDRIQQTILS
jgi:hypothetical protein